MAGATPDPAPLARPAPGPPSPWLQRWAHLVPAGSAVLDLACGSGRHLVSGAARGWRMTGVDRDADALAAAGSAQRSAQRSAKRSAQRSAAGLQSPGAPAELVQADLETGPWPWPGRQFDALLVFNYLWRPLWPQLLAALAPGGVLIYETFACGNQTVGKPSRPDFLLQNAELLACCAGLRVVAYEDGYLDSPPRFVQRVVAVQPARADGPPPRHALSAPGPAPDLPTTGDG